MTPTSQLVAPARTPLINPAVTRALVPLGVGIVLLGLLFHTEITAAVSVWRGNTAYNHCFIVIPLAAYLIWERRSVLPGLVPRPWLLPALLAFPIGVVWLIADRIGVMEGRQLIAMTLVELLLLTTLGWRLYRILLGPLLYLYFLVPFGSFITPQLQDFTTAFTTRGLDFVGIPNYSDGYSIQIPQGTFYVAEACAGLRFLVAAVAFGCLYALVIYRSPRRRALFIAISIVVPIIANGFRALGIVSLGYLLGSAQAAATDHVLYGWLFFSIVILLLVVLGLPFREDDKPPIRVAPEPGGLPAPGSAWPAAAAVVLLGAIGPLAGFGFDRAAAAGIPPAPQLSAGECHRIAPDTLLPSPVAGRIIEQYLYCGHVQLIVRTEVFSPRTTAGAIAKEMNRLTDTGFAEAIGTQRLGPFRMVQTEDPSHTSASALWVDGAPSGVGWGLRLRQARASMFGATGRAVIVTVMPNPDPSAQQPNGYAHARAAMQAWWERQSDLPAEMARLSAATE